MTNDDADARARIATRLADRMEEVGCQTFQELMERVAFSLRSRLPHIEGSELLDHAYVAIVRQLAHETNTSETTVRSALNAAGQPPISHGSDDSIS